MDTVQKKISRVEWIDTARGINILLMIMSHCMVQSLFLDFIASFLLPLFFVLTGYTMKLPATLKEVWGGIQGCKAFAYSGYWSTIGKRYIRYSNKWGKYSTVLYNKNKRIMVGISSSNRVAANLVFDFAFLEQAYVLYS